MKCFKCKSDRLVEINAKSSDCNTLWNKDITYEGYVPMGLGIGGGDYIEFEWCLNCGQIQGDFPLVISDFELVKENDE